MQASCRARGTATRCRGQRNQDHNNTMSFATVDMSARAAGAPMVFYQCYKLILSYSDTQSLKLSLIVILSDCQRYSSPSRFRTSAQYENHGSCTETASTSPPGGKTSAGGCGSRGLISLNLLFGLVCGPRHPYVFRT